jgi:hypothetical protein
MHMLNAAHTVTLCGISTGGSLEMVGCQVSAARLDNGYCAVLVTAAGGFV